VESKRFAYTFRRLQQRETDAEKSYVSWLLLLEGQIWSGSSTHSYCASNFYAY
jgi:hypothetical protein